MDGAPFTAFRHTADAVLEAAGESVADPAVADVDCGIGLLTGLISRLEGFRLRLLRTRGVVDRTVLSAELGVTRGQAAQLARMIERLDSLAALQTSLETGAVSFSKAGMIADTLNTPARVTAAAADETALVGLASLPAAQLARSLDRWGRLVDQAAGEDTDADLRAQRSLDSSKRASGMTEITARLDPESADIVNTAIDAKVNNEWEHESENEHGERTATQRRADALRSICNDWLNGIAAASPNHTSGSRARPHVSVIVDLATLTDRTGVAVTERGTVLTPEAARRICCDAGISRIITNTPSQLIDVGREKRLFTHGPRKALVLRDQGCRMEGCNAPPSQCDGHHIIHWADGGLTTTANGVLFCHGDHDKLHEGGWTVTGDANTMLTFTSPTGLVLTSWPRSLTTSRVAAA